MILGAAVPLPTRPVLQPARHDIATRLHPSSRQAPALGLPAPLLTQSSGAGVSPAAPGAWSVVEGSRARGPDGRRDTCSILRMCPGSAEPARGRWAAAKDDIGWRIGDRETRLRENSCAWTRNLARNPRILHTALWWAVGMPVSESACRSRLGWAGSETGGPSRHDWRFAGKPLSKSAKATPRPPQSHLKAC